MIGNEILLSNRILLYLITAMNLNSMILYQSIDYIHFPARKDAECPKEVVTDRKINKHTPS